MAPSNCAVLNGANMALPRTKAVLVPCAARARLACARFNMSQRKIQTDEISVSLGDGRGIQSEIARAGADVENARLGAPQHGANRLAPPSGVEAKTDDAVEQVITAGDPIKHVLHGSVARMI